MNLNFLHTKIYSRIRGAERILLVTHEKPDGDALGSTCAMMDLLLEMNKGFTAFCFTPTPLNFNYLPHVEKLSSDKTKLDFPSFDLIIAFDCGDLARTRLAPEISGRRPGQYFINIDHHPKVDDFADLEIKDDKAASTTELVYDFFRINKLPVNKNIANCILTGISVDTNNFLYQATTDRTVQISSEMIAKGASLPKIMDKTMRNKKISSLRLWGVAMSRLEINKTYNLGFTLLTKDDLREATDEDMEGIANYLGNLDSVLGVVTLFEKDNGIIKGSIRSHHPTADVSLLARKLGGGGHAKASGFTVPGRLRQVGEKWEIV